MTQQLNSWAYETVFIHEKKPEYAYNSFICNSTELETTQMFSTGEWWNTDTSIPWNTTQQ